MGNIIRGILSAALVTMVSIVSVSAQAPADTRVAVNETRKCEVHEIDDYKHAHFNHAMHDREDRRINIRKQGKSENKNYHQQAGSTNPEIIPTPRVREKRVHENDKVVRQRDYKRMNFVI